MIELSGWLYTVPMDVGRSLQRLRKDTGLSQSDLSEALRAYGVEMKQSGISMIENGTNQPSIPFLVACADYYGVTVDSILERDVGDPPPHYVSLEADAAAELIDTMLPHQRRMALRVIRALVEEEPATITDQYDEQDALVEQIIAILGEGMRPQLEALLLPLLERSPRDDNPAAAEQHQPAEQA